VLFMMMLERARGHRRTEGFFRKRQRLEFECHEALRQHRRGCSGNACAVEEVPALQAGLHRDNSAAAKRRAETCCTGMREMPRAQDALEWPTYSV
jgi:hypothetical protein